MPNTRFTLAQPTPSTQAFLIAGTQYLVIKRDFYLSLTPPRNAILIARAHPWPSLRIMVSFVKHGLHMPQQTCPSGPRLFDRVPSGLARG